jgi:hypothetical protein
LDEADVLGDDYHSKAKMLVMGDGVIVLFKWLL